MKQAKCEKGHIFDADTYSECPYCNQQENTINFADDSYEEIGKTAPLGGFGNRTVETPRDSSTIGKTVAPQAYRKKQEEMSKTVGVFVKKNDLDPVVGWLVCIEGHDKGKDYRILAKTNSIGRGEEMDICIKGDSTISSDRHAKIDYDVKNNKFYLLPAENKNTIYLNDAPVYAATMLNAYDTIQFGLSKVSFVPFCNEQFKWSDTEKAGDK